MTVARSRILEKLDAYERLIRLDKPIGFMLLMWPTLWALWIAARGQPDPMMAWIFILGTVLTRSAGVIANDLADMRYDGSVERTRDRPLVTGAVSRIEAVVLGVAIALAAFVLVLQLNALTIKLSFVAVAIAVTYPLLKRWFFLPQAYLGIAFGFGMPMAFAACLDQLPSVVWIMMLANVFWAIAYDTEYAMVDRNDDLRLGMRTSAITFGRFDVLAVIVCYVAMLATLAAVGIRLGFGVYYYLGLAGAAACMAYHYALIRGRERAACFRAFRHNNWVGAAIFVGIVLEHAMRGQ